MICHFTALANYFIIIFCSKNLDIHINDIHLKVLPIIFLNLLLEIIKQIIILFNNLLKIFSSSKFDLKLILNKINQGSKIILSV